ncbi:MAG: ABC transporter permease, partial [Thermohalobaculum sp.]|nr:ABC transporter permease [Thermohalobaculum sp.]
MSRILHHAAPVGAVVTIILALWYLGAVGLNAPWEYDQAARAGRALTLAELIPATMAQERPVLPAPHQVAVEIWQTTVEKPVTSKRS